jgi:hypothetical protein
MDESSSISITGLIDRDAPQQFGAVEPPKGKYFPGQIMSVSFDEPVKCSKPYAFTLSLKVEDMDRTFNKRNMLVVCEGRKISVTFTAFHNYEKMMGKDAVFKVGRVEDLAGNELVEPAKSEFTVQKIKTEDAEVQVSFLSLKNLSYVSTKSHKIEKEIVDLLDIEDASRIKVTQIKDDIDGILVNLRVLPAAEDKRDSAPTSCKLMSKLYDMIEEKDNQKKQSDISLLRLSKYEHLKTASVKQDGTFQSFLIMSDNDKAMAKAVLLSTDESDGKVVSHTTGSTYGVNDVLTDYWRGLLSVAVIAILAMQFVLVCRGRRKTPESK